MVSGCDPGFSDTRHEVAEAAGVISQSFGVDEGDRHNVLFKKVSESVYSPLRPNQFLWFGAKQNREVSLANQPLHIALVYCITSTRGEDLVKLSRRFCNLFPGPGFF